MIKIGYLKCILGIEPLTLTNRIQIDYLKHVLRAFRLTVF